MALMTRSNVKVAKGEGLGFLTFILHLAPAWLSGFNTCPMASRGCSMACLNTAGRGRFTRTQEARIRKTRRFFWDRNSFMAELVKEVAAAVRYAEKRNMTPVFRLNGTSDLRWETYAIDTTYTFRRKPVHVKARNIMELFPTVQFYDYTKIPNRRNLPTNYHLTFSRSESNDAFVQDILATDTNVAVVFDKLPETYLGRPVFDGTETDLRFLDPKGVIVGLIAKGKAKTDESGFVVRAQ